MSGYHLCTNRMIVVVSLLLQHHRLLVAEDIIDQYVADDVAKALHKRLEIYDGLARVSGIITATDSSRMYRVGNACEAMAGVYAIEKYLSNMAAELGLGAAFNGF